MYFNEFEYNIAVFVNLFLIGIVFKFAYLILQILKMLKMYIKISKYIKNNLKILYIKNNFV